MTGAAGSSLLFSPRWPIGSPTSRPVPSPWAVVPRAGPGRIKADADRWSHLLAPARPGSRERYSSQLPTIDGKDLAETLIAAGHAKPYDGGKRDPWCKH